MDLCRAVDAQERDFAVGGEGGRDVRAALDLRVDFLARGAQAGGESELLGRGLRWVGDVFGA